MANRGYQFHIRMSDPQPTHVHGSTSRLGVLITNLGTPEAPNPAALRRYLAEFLWDPRVVDLPRPLWWLILHGVILRVRPRRSAKLYQQIWTEHGSPLLVHCQRQAEALQARLDRHWAGQVQVALGMRYGQPAIRGALESLRARGVRRLLVLPLYPQYAASTTASTFDAVARVFKDWPWLPDLRVITGYHDQSAYIETVAASIREAWAQVAAADMLLFSFHGVPKRYLLAGDPYHCFCHATARRVAAVLGLEESRWKVVFQSRFGREEWLRPYADETLSELGMQGLASVDVVCPGFSADCLETLEEIASQMRQLFLDAGGKQFRYIPALNDRNDHLDMLTALVEQNLAGWEHAASPEELAGSRHRALALGASQ
jgi:ferrochelatase